MIEEINNAKMSMRYIGTYDSSRHYSIGDIVYKDGMTQCFDGYKFIVVGIPERVTNYVPDPESKKILPKNCVRCGAPVNSIHTKCEYCGCEY